jgi:hypothetical protein
MLPRVVSGTDDTSEPKRYDSVLRSLAHCLGGATLVRTLGAQLLDLRVHLGGGCLQLGDREARRLDVFVDEGGGEVVELLAPAKRLRQRSRKGVELGMFAADIFTETARLLAPWSPAGWWSFGPAAS